MILRMPGAIAHSLLPLYPDHVIVVSQQHRLSRKWTASLMELYPDGKVGKILFAFDEYDYDSEHAAAMAMEDCVEMAIDEVLIQRN